MVVVSAVLFYASIILFTRLAGLRSFSKMSGFDFAIALAIGSLLAATIVNKTPPLLQAIVALAMLYGLHVLVAILRHRLPFVSRVVDNQPLLLMVHGEMLHHNLHKARVTEEDVYVKLRLANVLTLESVHAVVMETTGDVSVLHGSAPSGVDPVLLQDVIDGERFTRGT